jgi:hypothetical protein
MSIEGGTAIVLTYLLVSIGVIVAFIGAVFMVGWFMGRQRQRRGWARRRVTYQAAPNVIVDAAKAMHVLEAPAGPWGEPESNRPPLPFAPPHSATASGSKGRLIRCTVHLSCASTEVAYAVIMRPAAVELTALR